MLSSLGQLEASTRRWLQEGQAGARFCLRFRWYRSVVQRSGANCWIHPDKQATLQCVLCLRSKVDIRKSYHCTPACLREHWHWHKELHEQRRQNGALQAGGALTEAWDDPLLAHTQGTLRTALLGALTSTGRPPTATTARPGSR